MRKLILCVLASALTVSAVSTGASQAQPYPQRHYHHSYYHSRARCYHDKRRAGNQGTALGAVSGGVLGGVIGHGLVGGLVGAGVGAVAGHAIAKGTVHC